MAWYRTGSVTLTPGSNLVLGTGTSFLTNVKNGDMFIDKEAVVYEITNVLADAQLQLATPYLGEAYSGSEWTVAPTAANLKILSKSVTDLVAIYQDIPENVEVAQGAVAQTLVYRNQAVSAKGDAELAKNAAEIWRNDAVAAKTAAETAVSSIGTSVEDAQSAALTSTTAATTTLEAKELTLDAAATAVAASEDAQAVLVSAVKVDDLASPAGVAAFAFTAAEAQSIFDNALPKTDYGELRAYNGRAKSVNITGNYALSTPDGIAGFFRRVDSDSTSADNGGTIIVDALGRRWYRVTDAVTFGHFGAVGNWIADDTQPIRNAVEFALTSKCDLHGVAGRTYRVTGEINFPKKHSGVIREYITFDGHGCRVFIDGTGITAFGFTKATGSGILDAANYYLMFQNINFTANTGSGCIAVRPAGFITSQYRNLHFNDVDYPFWAQKADPRNTPDYVQSARILGCYSVRHKRFFTAPRVYDFVLDDTIIDAGVDGVLIDFGATGQSAYSMRICKNIIQSQTGIGLAVGGAQGLVIESNYFENNSREFVALHSGTVVNYGGSIQYNFIQPKNPAPAERLAAFDLGGCSSSGFKLGGNIAQDQKLYNWNTGLSLGYFDTTNDRSAMPLATLYHPTVRPVVRAIFNDGARWGLLWGNSGGMILNPVSRGIEYTHEAYDVVDPTDNLRVPIVQGVASTYPVGYGSGLDGTGASPGMYIAGYVQKFWTRGSYLANPTPAELGTAGSKYVIKGWICTVSGRPGTWAQCRALTGG